MKYKKYILLNINGGIYATKGNYRSIESFRNFEEAKKYIDTNGFIKLYPPEANFSGMIKQIILPTLYIIIAYIVINTKYSAPLDSYAYEYNAELGNHILSFLIAFELIRLILILSKYTLIYFKKGPWKISYADTCDNKELIKILLDKGSGIFSVLISVILLRFTVSTIFLFIPIILFIISVIRWETSIGFSFK